MHHESEHNNPVSPELERPEGILPKFPIMKPIELKDKATVTRYTKQFPPNSDYNFLSMWSYNTQNGIALSEHNGSLVVRFEDYVTGDNFYSFMGHNTPETTADILLKQSEVDQLSPVLKLVPSATFDQWDLDNTPFSILTDRDNYDYILSTKEISQLAGNKYHTQKNHVNRFNRQYFADTREVDLKDPQVQGAVMQLFDLWVARKNLTGEDAAHEREALTRTIQAADLFKLLNIAVYEGDKMIGCMIADVEDPVYAEAHFAKGDTEYHGVFDKLYMEMGKSLYQKGYEFLNIEQDLGIPGLRKSKEAWNPVHYLEKYTITKAE